MIVFKEYDIVKKDMKRIYKKLSKKYSENFHGMNCTETGVEFHFNDQTVLDEVHLNELWQGSDFGIIHKCMKSLNLI